MSEKLKFDPVIMPIIRRVWPTLIAQSIIGVQPMTAPFSFTHRYNYALRDLISVNNEIYKHFLRLNNRKKQVRCSELSAAGYPSIQVKDIRSNNYTDWCNTQFGTNAWIENSGVFWFRDEKDATLFRLTWEDDLANE